MSHYAGFLLIRNTLFSSVKLCALRVSVVPSFFYDNVPGQYNYGPGVALPERQA